MTTASATTCTHCGRARKIRSRGLCRGCHDVPGVRGLYAPATPPDRFADDPGRKPCRNCSRPFLPGRWAKTLCWKCRTDDAARDRHRLRDNPADRRGVPDGNGPRPDPATPTAHPPGSPGKVAVLVERAAAGVGLWHESDAGPPPDAPTPDDPAFVRTADTPRPKRVYRHH